MTRIVFMGTPHAAIPVMEAMADSGLLEMVVTQPDRPKGRSKEPSPPPVAGAARSLGLPVQQPESRNELLAVLEKTGPWDLGVVVAYGRILTEQMLKVAKHGFLNAHFSLLPRWRGAAPVQRAIMAGDPMTGVTVIRLDRGLDTGPVLTAQAIDIGAEETGGELEARLSSVAARLLADSVGPYLLGSLEPTPQSDEGVTYATKIEGADRELAVTSSPRVFVDHVRALAPEPGAVLAVDGERFKVMRASTTDHEVEPGEWRAHDGRIVVGLKGGSVALDSIRPPGRNVMSGADWIRGARRSQGIAG